MVTRLGRAERAAVWVLCKLLPAGFRARQHAEWAGDLIALSGGRWRYLMAAALTLPALRAHVRRSGLDSPAPAVQASLPARVVAGVLYAGLGLPVLSWFIAIPFRYVVLDIPGRFAHLQDNPQPFDPKDLWPMDGPLIVLIPLWIALSIGAWTALISPLLLTFVASTAVVVIPRHLGAQRFGRITAILLGTILLLLVAWFTLIDRGVPVWYAIDLGLTAALLGCLALLAGLRLRGLSPRRRFSLVLVGLGGIAVFVTHHLPVGAAMLNWYLD